MRFALAWIGWFVVPALAGTAPAGDPASVYRPFGPGGGHLDLGWTGDPLLDRLDSRGRRPWTVPHPSALGNLLDQFWCDRQIWPDWESLLKRFEPWRWPDPSDRAHDDTEEWRDPWAAPPRYWYSPPPPLPEPDGPRGQLWFIAEAERQAQ